MLLPLEEIRAGLAASCLGIALSLVTTASPADEIAWPAFLGAGAQGVQAADLPGQWDPEKQTAWVAELPDHGQSSPVVWNNAVFVTSVEGPRKEKYHVVCLDVQSGKELWKKQIDNSVPFDNSLYVSRAAPTPVVDAQRLVTFFESGDCVAWTHDGKQIWRRNLAADYGPIEAKFGLGASPCQTDQHVFILLEHDGPSCLLALDKSTGSTAWKVDRPAKQSWSSPAIVQVDGQPHLVVSSLGSVSGYDPNSGKQLWKLEDVGGNTGVTPIDAGNSSFLIGAAGGRQGENEAIAKKSNGLVKVTREGDSFSAKKVWVNEEVSPSWASPFVHQGLAYWINRAGVVTCVDAETGKSVFTKRTQQSCWATPLGAGNRIYFFGKDGLCTVMAAGREGQVLSENKLWTDGALVADSLPVKEESTQEKQASAAMFSGPTVYGYAVAGKRLIVRIGKQLFCLGS
jgi:outer membrane protein assembly factor BamB